jgi:ABC-type multidrug transport system ATPase subunit
MPNETSSVISPEASQNLCLSSRPSRISASKFSREIVGLVGCNGAGKTTTLRAIAGILRPTSGSIRVGGFDIRTESVAAKRLLAYIPDTIHPYDLLTVTEHLHFIALAYQVEDAEAKYGSVAR